jgi:vancomycin permeability regulator SanA
VIGWVAKARGWSFRQFRRLPFSRSVRRWWAFRSVRAAVYVASALALALVACVGWTWNASFGRVSPVEEAPTAPVAVVFGAQLAPGGTEPMPFLAGRLDVAARLVAAGRARAVLVSGDARGLSGNESTAMSAYLVRSGVPARMIVADPVGLDYYDTCARAARVYGVRRALLVTQAYHLPRAVALCRRLGIDAYGVQADCRDCRYVTLAANTAREMLASVKAVRDAASRRPPAVVSPPDPAVTNALRAAP